VRQIGISLPHGPNRGTRGTFGARTCATSGFLMNFDHCVEHIAMPVSRFQRGCGLLSLLSHSLF
jgi:hypothetical protein